jgi:hypothetical protein
MGYGSKGRAKKSLPQGLSLLIYAKGGLHCDLFVKRKCSNQG